MPGLAQRAVRDDAEEQQQQQQQQQGDSQPERDGADGLLANRMWISWLRWSRVEGAGWRHGRECVYGRCGAVRRQTDRTGR